MALIGYARVSTAEQDTALQTDALRKAGCARIFEDTVSGVSFSEDDCTECQESFALSRSPEVGMSFMPWFCFHRRQSLQNAAGVHGLLALTTLT